MGADHVQGHILQDMTSGDWCDLRPRSAVTQGASANIPRDCGFGQEWRHLSAWTDDHSRSISQQLHDAQYMNQVYYEGSEVFTPCFQLNRSGWAKTSHVILHR